MLSTAADIRLFGGDFRQVTPVVRKGSRVQGPIAAAYMKNAAFWQHAEKMHSTINMRIEDFSGPAAQVHRAFSASLALEKSKHTQSLDQM